MNCKHCGKEIREHPDGIRWYHTELGWLDGSMCNLRAEPEEEKK